MDRNNKSARQDPNTLNLLRFFLPVIIHWKFFPYMFFLKASQNIRLAHFSSKYPRMIRTSWSRSLVNWSCKSSAKLWVSTISKSPYLSSTDTRWLCDCKDHQEEIRPTNKEINHRFWNCPRVLIKLIWEIQTRGEINKSSSNERIAKADEQRRSDDPNCRRHPPTDRHGSSG